MPGIDPAALIKTANPSLRLRRCPFVLWMPTKNTWPSRHADTGLIVSRRSLIVRCESRTGSSLPERPLRCGHRDIDLDPRPPMTFHGERSKNQRTWMTGLPKLS